MQLTTSSPAAPTARIPPFDRCALLLDIDGTLVDLAPTPREVKVAPGLVETMQALMARLSGALAVVSGRSLDDIDFIFGPARFPAVGGHGAEMRLSIDEDAVAISAPPMEAGLKRRFAALAQLDPNIVVEDKGYSIALHFRLAPDAETQVFEGVSKICAELPNAPIEVLPGKAVCEIKSKGFSKATGVHELMTHAPFAGRRPVFIGDDVTDESVFAIMPEYDGLAFSVGRHAQGIAGRFDSPADVRAWLSRLLRDRQLFEGG
ncbi:MAG TPA: trehalose-phosphatase [Xanthobacteraceae bacterium]|nr:trehalose-phosphatase [Xanthobacteraceae bacterium]